MERGGRKEKTTCKDDDGNERRHDEKWSEHDCRHCHCDVSSQLMQAFLNSLVNSFVVSRHNVNWLRCIELRYL